MASETFFTTQKTDTGTVFTVHPARSSFFLRLLAMGFALYFGWFLLNLLLGTPIRALVAFSILGIVAFLFRSKTGQRPAQPVRNKKAFEITVKRDGLVLGKEFYPGNDIAEFSIVAPNAPVASSHTVAFAGTGMMGLSAGLAAAGVQGAMNAGQVIGAQIAARSNSLMLRKRSHNKPIPIACGLTAQAAQALMNDIIEAMR